MIEVTEADRRAQQQFYAACKAGMDSADLMLLEQAFAANRQQAEDAMRERCLSAVDNEKVDADATGDEGDALYNRAIEDAYTAIRNIDARAKGEG